MSDIYLTDILMALFFCYDILNQKPFTGVITLFTIVAICYNAYICWLIVMLISFVNVMHFVSARDLLAIRPSVSTHSNNLKQVV